MKLAFNACEYSFFLTTIFGKPRWGLKKNKFENNSARASRFFVHFFVVTARLRHESALWWRAKTQYSDFCFLFQNFYTVFRRSERDEKSEIKFEAARIHFLSDVCGSFRHHCCLSFLRFPSENVE